VSSFHGSGSTQTATCSTTTGSNVANCPGGTADFAAGQGVQFANAGPRALYSIPAFPSVTTVGTKGSTTYCYKIATADYWFGISAASSPACVSDGNASPSPVNYSKIVVSGQNCHYCATAIYRQTGGSGPFALIAMLSAIPNGTLDDSNLPAVTASGYPLVAPASPVNQAWTANITAVGSNILTLDAAAPASASSVVVSHDNQAAIQAAVNAVCSTGGTVLLDAGTYAVNRFSYNQNGTWIYTNPTSEVAANNGAGLIHLGGSASALCNGVAIRGVGTNSTSVTSFEPGYSFTAIFADATASPNTLPGALCNTVGVANLTKYSIANVSAGATQIVTSTPGDALKFNAGDIVYYGGGVANGDAACGVPGSPAAEINRVVSVNGAGVIVLDHPVTKNYPFGPVGTANFVAQVNSWAHHDLGISDMTINGIGGGGTIGLNDCIHCSVTNVDIPAIAWTATLSGAEERDVVFDNDDIRSTGSEELDEVRQVVIRNSRLLLEAGSNQFAASEGATGVQFDNDQFTSDDSFCGLQGRCDYLAPTTLSLSGGGGDYQITNSSFTANWVEPFGGAVTTTNPTSVPVLDGMLIQGNTFNLQSASAITGINLLAPATHQTVSTNTLYMDGAVANSQGIRISTGLVDSNSLTSATDVSHNGVIDVSNAVAQTEPLTISNNIITLSGFSDAIYTNLSAPTPVTIGPGNSCSGSANGTGIVSTGSVMPTIVGSAPVCTK
jgi:hypothetical protein